jgi:hypothetical protein
MHCYEYCNTLGWFMTPSTIRGACDCCSSPDRS